MQWHSFESSINQIESKGYGDSFGIFMFSPMVSEVDSLARDLEF